jgi:hypothetical protein
MPEPSGPLSAHVIVPVDAVTAERAASAGHTITWALFSGATVTFECAPTEPLAVEAAELTYVHRQGDMVKLDVSRPLQLKDFSPPIPPDIPGPERNPLWWEPRREPEFSGFVHLPVDAPIDDLPNVVIEWLRRIPRVDGQTLVTLQRAWRAQAQRMLDHATAMVEQLPTTLTADERQGVLSRLHLLANQARHAAAGGLNADDPDLVSDGEGGLVARPAHLYVNDAYHAVLDACHRSASSDGDRGRGSEVLNELARVAHARRSDLPPRFAKALRLGMLDTMLGAARHELLDIAWPEWRYLTDGEELRDVVNPSLEALDALERRQADRKATPWVDTDDIALRWLIPSKRPVLSASFLGRAIVCEFPLENGDDQ